MRSLTECFKKKELEIHSSRYKMKVLEEEEGQKKRRWQRQEKEEMQEEEGEAMNGGGRGRGWGSLKGTTDISSKESALWSGLKL